MLISPANNGSTRRKRSRARRRNSHAGFSLPEVVLALALMALLATLGLPFVRPLSGRTALHAKALEIVALLRADRNTALRRATDGTVAIDTVAGTIISQQSKFSVVLPPAMKISISPADARGFLFHADGRAVGGQLSIVSGRNAVHIDIDDLTGTVRIVDANDAQN